MTKIDFKALAEEMAPIVDKHLAFGNMRALQAFFWDNKIGILRALQVLGAQQDGARDAAIEECAKIADAVMNDADRQAMKLSYGELYGMECRSDAAREIAKTIRALIVTSEQGVPTK